MPDLLLLHELPVTDGSRARLIHSVLRNYVFGGNRYGMGGNLVARGRAGQKLKQAVRTVVWMGANEQLGGNKLPELGVLCQVKSRVLRPKGMPPRVPCVQLHEPPDPEDQTSLVDQSQLGGAFEGSISQVVHTWDSILAVAELTTEKELCTAAELTEHATEHATKAATEVSRTLSRTATAVSESTKKLWAAAPESAVERA